MVERATNALESFKQTNDKKGIPYKNCASFKEANKYLNNAKEALENGNCDAVKWNANTFENHIANYMELCIYHTEEFKKLKILTSFLQKIPYSFKIHRELIFLY